MYVWHMVLLNQGIADLQDLLAVIHSEQNIKEEDVSATQRQHEQDVLSHLDELLPYYHHDGISFNQFVFLYNHLLNVTNHDTVTSTEKVRLKKKNSTVSHANQGLLSPVVYHEVLTEIERLLARQELSEDEAKLLYTIEDPTEIHPDEILDHEKQLVDCKLKLAGLVSLYSKTKSKMMLGNLKRELAWYKHNININCFNIYKIKSYVHFMTTILVLVFYFFLKI